MNDELVAGAFAARERVKQGDYDFVEHPLERRANEAKQNDCKVREGRDDFVFAVFFFFFSGPFFFSSVLNPCIICYHVLAVFCSCWTK